MRIDEVRADAFGPFEGDVLDLGPGMNVVHGPNEAGKSSWFAATFAALAGLRRPRTASVPESNEFADRHRPWRGSQWRAGVSITLDDGRRLRIDRDLRHGDTALQSGAAGTGAMERVSVSILEESGGRALSTDGVFDATALLGLNRHSARATIFTGQSDVLRVLADSSELQDLIERAAASQYADGEAGPALAWLSASQPDPEVVAELQAAVERRRSELTAAQASRDRLIELLGDQRAVRRDLSAAKREVELVQRIEVWREIKALEKKLVPARLLASQIDERAGRYSSVDEAQITRATMLLGAYQAGGVAPKMPDGASASELEAQLAQLPAAPEGDLEPREVWRDIRRELTEATVLLQAHDGKAPPAPSGTPEVESAVSSTEVRRFAEVLEAEAPQLDPDDLAEAARLRAQNEEQEFAYRRAKAEFDAWHRQQQELQGEEDAEPEDEPVSSEDTDVDPEQGGDSDDTVVATPMGPEAAGAVPVAASDDLGDDRVSRLVVGLGLVAVVTCVLGIALVGVRDQSAQGWLVLWAGVAVGAVALFLLLRSRSEPEGDPDHDELLPSPQRDSAMPSVSAEDESAVPAAAQGSADSVDDASEADLPIEPEPPEPDARLAMLTSRLDAQEVAVQRFEEQVNGTLAVLNTHGLPHDPERLRLHADQLDQGDAASREYQAFQDEGDRLRTTQQSVAERLLEALSDEVPAVEGAADSPYDPVVASAVATYETYVAACRARVHESREAAGRGALEAALQQRVQLERDYHAVMGERSDRDRRLIEFADELRPGNPTANTDEAADLVKRWVATQEAARAERANLSELTARLDQLLQGSSIAIWEQELAQLQAAAGDEPTEIPPDLGAFKEAATARYEDLLRQLGDLAGQSAQLERTLGSVAMAHEALAEAQREVTRVQQRQRCLVDAFAELRLARDRANANIAPALEERIQPWLPQITKGRYVAAAVNSEDLRIQVTESGGHHRDARLLSQGTTEQIFLLLRLALAQVLGGDVEEVAPLLFDDVTVQSDHARTIAILGWLHELSATHQVVVFTQEREVVSWAQEHLTAERDRVTALPERTTSA